MSRPDIPMMTEREVRLAGQSSNMLCQLRGLSAEATGGNLAVTANGAQHYIPLIGDTVLAVLDFLKEREEAFLTGLNVELETAN